MLKFLLLMIPALLTYAEKLDPVADQVAIYKEQNECPATLTTNTGAPVELQDVYSNLNKVILQNDHAIELFTNFVRERTPVRCVHTKGAGAFGYFELTHDISHICRAEFLNGVGKKTPIAVRFSLSFAERGGADLTRETRGFAVKFYTEEGNFDMPGFNTPMFVLKDPYFLPHLVHAVRLNPVNDLKDLNTFWDYIINRPESIFIFLMLFSDEGIHDGYRHMPGFSIHTYPLYNEAGEITFSRFYLRPVGGVKYLNTTEATKRAAMDPDYCARDLYNYMSAGGLPTWDVLIQPISPKNLKNLTLDIFDISKEIPESMFPLIPIGKLVLNRLPKNYFAEVEQMAYAPGNLVRGILGAPDKAFEARRFLYRDAQRYRLGVNFDNIEVNKPYRSKVHTYNRDGVPPIGGNGYDRPNYYPNTFNGPMPYVDKNRPTIPKIHEEEANNFDQARNYYNNRLVGKLRVGLINNIATSLCGTIQSVQLRAVKILRKVSDDLADRVAKALKQCNK